MIAYRRVGAESQLEIARESRGERNFGASVFGGEQHALFAEVEFARLRAAVVGGERIGRGGVRRDGYAVRSQKHTVAVDDAFGERFGRFRRENRQHTATTPSRAAAIRLFTEFIPFPP